MSVYHTYDYHYLLFGASRKIQMFPCKNKYTNPLQIKTINFYDLNDTYTKYFVELLQCFYIPDDSILFTLVEKDAKSLFSGHFATPYISFYNEKNIVSTSARTKNSMNPFEALSTNIEVGLFPEPKGCIGSFPVRVFFHPKGHSFEANFFTFVATDRSYDDQHIARHLISTHDYNCRRHNPDIHAGVLKKDVGACDGVVPFLEFSTLAIRLFKPKRAVRNIVQVYRQNWDAMFDTLRAVSVPNGLFDFVMTVDIGAVKARIDGGIWFVFAYCDKGNVLAMYFIENSHMLYEKTSAKTLRLVASINNGLSAERFQQGLADCLRKLIKQNLDYKILLVDTVGHNAQIVAGNFGQVMAETAGAYYFINWVFVERLVSDRAFLLT